MSGKDEFIFNKINLLKTNSGRKILKRGILKDKGYLQFKSYVDLSKKEYGDFVKRFQNGIFNLIKSDASLDVTHKSFIEDIGGSPDFELDFKKLDSIKKNLLNYNVLSERIIRILNSNFIKMTFPIFYALFDGYASGVKNNSSILELRNYVIDGHLIAIDLSEPMDRIIDKDEDLDYLDDYRFLNPYILILAKQNISKAGQNVFKEFQSGFRDALYGQQVDYEMKTNARDLNYENLDLSYKKYRSVLGTAGKNMSLNQKPLSEIYYIGMAKAAECVGCGNEIQDAIATEGIKSPSWPLFYSFITKDVRKGFILTLKKSESYLSEAYLALDMLDDDFELKPFLSFLFLTVSHYNEFWFKELFSNRLDLINKFQKDINKQLANNITLPIIKQFDDV